jgi:alkylation response protein AidB-like acyl-CoA dehydrogenase
MNFGFDETQEDLRKVTRDLFASRNPESRLRAVMETSDGFDRELWSEMAAMGLTGLAISEEHGGAGCGPVEVGVIMEEAGRSLLASPLLSTVLLATSTLQATGDARAQAELLPKIADGSIIATVGWVGDNPRWGPDDVKLRATRSGDGWAVDGVVSYVPDGHAADVVMVLAHAPGGVSLLRAEPNERQKLEMLDATRPLARLTFDNAPATLIGTEGDGWRCLTHAIELTLIGLGAEQVGAAQFTLDMSVEYAKIRQQFGKPIGSFQAIKHKLADVLVAIESARSAVDYALWVASEPSAAAELPLVASLVKSYCSEASLHAATACIQVHGGIGFTWEHPAHLYFKRAKGSELLFGTPADHRKLLAQLVLN